ncbi:MAG TPA: hypothetical protein VFP49_09650 [Nitrososphaeraceae archaeon]|nr:hypothetical protein [Nitrososphaeraceae archaeon]
MNGFSTFNSDSVLRFGNSAYEHSEFRIGKRIAFPAGIIHLRITGCPYVPVRNHTAPRLLGKHPES